MKIAFVVQRYGLNINGGAEHQCRSIAERLAENNQVDVLTTTSSNYTTWEHCPDVGNETLNKVHIKRFRVDFQRNPSFFNQIYDLLVSLYKWQTPGNHDFNKSFNGLDLFQLLKESQNKNCLPSTQQYSHDFDEIQKLRQSLEDLWIKQQGPYSSSLFEYISSSKDKYDCFIFFSYTYSHCALALPSVAKKSILVPTAHNDPCFGFSVFDILFEKCQFYICQTQEERNLLENRMQSMPTKNFEITSIGVVEPNEIKALEKDKNSSAPFILCLGRLDPSKGTTDLLENFSQFKKNNPENKVQLYLAGESTIPTPILRDVKYLGVVSDQVKWSLLNECEFLVNPSQYESLSIVLLEAWLMKKPTLVNRRCEATLGQTKRSGGGLVYFDQESFDASTLKLLDKNNKDSKDFGANGYSFVSKYYNWDEVIRKYTQTIRKVVESNL